MDAALLERPANKELQLDLSLDYASNVKMDPAFQAYFRQYQPPLLAICGRNDAFFIPLERNRSGETIPTRRWNS